MNLSKCCKCSYTRCRCDTVESTTLVPIIEKKKKAVVTKSCIKPEPCKVTQSKCPTNRIVSISRLGDKAVVTLSDCTYYEADLSTIDFSTFSIGSGLTVISVKAKESGNVLEITYRDINTGEITKEDVIIEGDTQDIENLINNLNNKIDASKIKSTELNNGTFTITLEDNTKFDTDLSGLITADKFVNSGAIISGNKLQLSFNDGSSVEIDCSGLITADKFVNSGAVISGNKLQLNFNDGSSVEIDLSSIVVTSSGETVLITGGSINGNTLTLNLSNNTSIDVDITDLISGIVNQVTNNIESTVIENATNQVINNFLKLGYRINTQDSNYTLVQDDFDGRTIVRMNSASNQTLTVIKPDSEEKIGTVVMVRRSNGNAGTLLTLVAGEGVTLSPVDISPLRRIGSSVSLIYIGKGYWDVFGELP